MNKDYLELLESISKRPGMYVGETSIRKVSILLAGYSLGREDNQKTMLIDWQRWIEFKFKIFHPAWHWSRILLHYFESDQDAISSLPNLYKEYVKEYSPSGEELEKRCRKKLMELYGQDWYSPVTTKTSDPS